MMSPTKEKNSEDQIIDFSKRKIIKNLSLISVSFLLLFVSYDGLSMLQTSMNQKKGIGVTSQAVIYLGFGISSLLLPKYVIKKIGCKTAIFVGMAMYLPYEASNYYPEFYTMIPTAILVGIGASLIWGAQCTYYNECCFRYWKIICNSNSKQRQTVGEISDENHSDNVHGSKELKQGDQFFHVPLETDKATLQTVSECKLENDQYVSETIVNKISIVNIIATNCQDSNIAVVFKNNAPNYVLNNEYAANPICEQLFEKVTNTPTNDLSCESTDNKNSNKFVSENGIFKATSLDSINALFFGFHGFIYQSSMCYSNLMSYFILNKDHADTNVSVSSGCYCGAKFCNELACFESQTLEEMPSNLRYMLTTISLALGVIGVLLIIFFVDHLGDKQPSIKFSFELLFASLRHAKKKEQIFLIPLSFYVGMEQGFFIGDYTRSYVACSLGTYKVGLITMTYGLTCAIASPLAGVMVKLIGRIPVFLVGLVIDISTCLLLLFWKPEPDQLYMFFVASALFGIFTGIFWSQVVAFYGILFKKDEEAAFGFHYLCSSMGTTLSFAYNDYLCSYKKIYALITVATLGIIGYIMCERRNSARKKESSENQ